MIHHIAKSHETQAQEWVHIAVSLVAAVKLLRILLAQQLRGTPHVGNPGRHPKKLRFRVKGFRVLGFRGLGFRGLGNVASGGVPKWERRTLGTRR